MQENTVKCLEHGPFIQAVINQISVISSHIYRKLTLKLLLRQTQPFFGNGAICTTVLYDYSAGKGGVIAKYRTTD